MFDQLIDARRVGAADAQMRAALAGSSFVQLSAYHYYPAPAFAALRWYEQRRLRALAAGKCAHRAVLAGRSAARLLGMWTMNFGDFEPVELILPSGNVPGRSRTPTGVRYRRSVLHPDEVVRLHGVRCTSLIRTCFDIAARHGFREGLVAADWLLSHGGVTRAELEGEFAVTGRFKGKGTVRKVLKYATGLSESAFESWFRALLIELGWPFEFQPSVAWYRPDFLIHGFVAVEIDGNSKYEGMTEEQLLREKRRQDTLTNMGLVFARFAPMEIIRDEERVLRTIQLLVENRGRPQLSGQSPNA
ncbi:hypothetical protein [Corynebacterium qintianiae]|uniref:hypothetical protein n=1 Tax=Corynebacterium qintianiae TaxID=2709392 RepID=UPI0013E9B948|nr:hypothetical protein [Corynebacterium qintianiae]